MPIEDAKFESPVGRRVFLKIGAGTGAAAVGLVATACADTRQQNQPVARAGPNVSAFELDERSVADLSVGLQRGTYTSRALVDLYLGRIAAIDKAGPAINSVIETNPDAASTARSLDAERKAGKVRGPLHGIPILIKDNIDTADRMRTSAGSLALAGSHALADADIVKRLRAAGAVILGKTNLSEWANIRSARSTSGWSGRGGLTRNPYALDRNACGSSSGTGAAIAASLAAIGVGTETDGSIVCPANANGLVGLKPTVGGVSGRGIIPISHSQDTAGPMCRTVRDAAVLLTVLEGGRPAAAGGYVDDYTRYCVADGLRGVRIGVVRSLFNAGPAVDRVMEEALRAMSRAGATLIDPVAIPTLGDVGGHEFEVLLYELKAGMAAYLATRGPNVGVKTLADLIQYNRDHAATEMPFFGQDTFEAAEAKGPLTDRRYLTALATARRLTRDQGLDRAVAAHQLEVLVAPTGGPAWLTDLVNGDHFGGGSSTLSAVSGYPALTVPMGDVHGLPIGVTFMGAAWSEGTLIKCGYAFEQITRKRVPPRFLATVAL